MQKHEFSFDLTEEKQINLNDNVKICINKCHLINLVFYLLSRLINIFHFERNFYILYFFLKKNRARLCAQHTLYI